jgi:hypothetical protein
LSALWRCGEKKMGGETWVRGALENGSQTGRRADRKGTLRRRIRGLE